MEHYECDGQISMFDYWDEALKYNETKDDCDGQINMFRYLDKYSRLFEEAGKMQIFVDADACPVVDIVETIAEKYNIKTTLLCDTNHVLYSDYSEVIVVGAGADAVDYKLISLCHRGDIVVSQDYGVAAMALGKAAYAIYQSGRWYTDENIDRMLMERHLNKKARRSSHKNHIKGPKRRTEEDDERFAQSFEKMILMAKSKED